MTFKTSAVAVNFFAFFALAGSFFGLRATIFLTGALFLRLGLGFGAALFLGFLTFFGGSGFPTSPTSFSISSDRPFPVVYRLLEDWSWVDAVYFSVVAVTTVGFGDLTPTTDVSKLFTVVYVLTGISIITTYLHARMGRRGRKRVQS